MSLFDYNHIERVHGSKADWLASKTNYVAGAAYYTYFPYSENYRGRDNDVDIQCELHELGGEMDPALMNYEQKLAYYIKEFAYTTSGHGIPMIARASNKVVRTWWITLFTCSLGMYFYQISNVIEKYQRHEKIVDIQLVFDAAPFPAITMCNLNPYKKSSASNYELVRRTLNAFNEVMGAASGGDATHHRRRREADEQLGEQHHGDQHVRRAKRQQAGGHKVFFEAAEAVCRCQGEGIEMDCEANKERVPAQERDPDNEPDPMCYCAFDRNMGDAWPCYPKERWFPPKVCYSCNDEGYCNAEPGTSLGTAQKMCLCNDINDFCLAIDDIPEGAEPEVLKTWQFYGRAKPTEDPAFLRALGFEGMTDEVAIVTKAKENIVFAMATLTVEERQNLSFTRTEFVHKCSFNGAQCAIEQDFTIHPDPSFGNCFTFNHNRSTNLTSVRAGPMYGLRLIVYVNASEYLPTTEASGIKMTIHEKVEFPFPDTFGYNAPVGYISSFGIKLKRMERLGPPFGECVIDGRTEGYIYENYDYSTEGCFRSCFQEIVSKECGCGDPRHPVFKGYKHCAVADPAARKCLDERTKNSGGDDATKCVCQQPCKQSSYSVTYSASVWPSKSLQVQLGVCEGDHVTCNQHYKENGAMIEVFFEQLNYELLHESEAYGVVNLLSDFGGQFGLWLGVSVITVCEFVFIVVHLLWISGHHHYYIYEKEKMERKAAAEEAT